MRFNSSSQPTTHHRHAVTLTELLAVISIIATLTSFGFYAFSSARQFGTRQETEAGAAIARANVNSQIRRIPSAPSANVIQPQRKRPFVPHGGPDGYQQIGTSPIAPHTPYRESLTRSRIALDAYFARASISEIADRPHFIAAPIYDTYPVGAPVAPPVWKTTYDPAADTFKLHSKPGSNLVIYLDFDGNSIPATNSWAIDFNNGVKIDSLAWSMDADRTTFSTIERNMIIKVWGRVAEDFAPFDVDVTTEPPLAADLVSTGGSDTKWGIRVVIGPRPPSPGPNDWSTAGGIAYRPSFKNSVDICCWAWNGDSSANPDTSLPTTISHEVGHTLGLRHDGDSTKTPPDDEYYPGHNGTGLTSWGPIMGGSFSKNIDQWSRASYPGANNNEDDLSIITGGTSGLTYRVDDHSGGDNGAAPTALNTAGQAALTTYYGIIEKNTDVDVFVFYADPGTINITVDPLSYAPNLDVKADLYGPTGTLVASGTRPANPLAVEFKGGVSTPGPHQLRISGTGRGSAADGYTNYGSLGNYRIMGTVQPMTPIIGTTPGGSGGSNGGGIRVLNPTRWTFDPASQTFWGYLAITNLGTTPLSGTFKINMTLPDASLTVVEPAGGVQVGSGFTGSFTATLVQNQTYNLLLRLQNPSRMRLPTGHNSFPVVVQQ